MTREELLEIATLCKEDANHTLDGRIFGLHARLASIARHLAEQPDHVQRAEERRERDEKAEDELLRELIEERDDARADVERLTVERDEALAKADQYERDWYSAKSDFGTAMGKQRERARTASHTLITLIGASAPENIDETAERAAAEIEQLRTEVRRLTDEKNGAYLERNQVVAVLAKCFPSGRKRTAIEGWSEDWHGCVFIDLPTGQASWHYHDSQAYLFESLPPYEGEWDGHSTPDKYRRLAALNAAPPAEVVPRVAKSCPDCGEDGLCNLRCARCGHECSTHAIACVAPRCDCERFVRPPKPAEASEVVTVTITREEPAWDPWLQANRTVDAADIQPSNGGRLRLRDLIAIELQKARAAGRREAFEEAAKVLECQSCWCANLIRKLGGGE